jgi:hypothetical protein
MILKLLLVRGFFAHFDLAGLNQLVIPDGITITRVDSTSMSCQFPAEKYSSGGYLAHELVIPPEITVLSMGSTSMS